MRRRTFVSFVLSKAFDFVAIYALLKVRATAENPIVAVSATFDILLMIVVIYLEVRRFKSGN